MNHTVSIIKHVLRSKKYENVAEMWYRCIFTSCSHGDYKNDHESANIWVHNPRWIDLKTQQHENESVLIGLKCSTSRLKIVKKWIYHIVRKDWYQTPDR